MWARESRILQRIHLQCRNPNSIPRSGRSSGEGIGYPRQYSWVSLVAQLVNNPHSMRQTCLGSIPGLGRPPGGGHGNPLQYSCLENPHEQRNLAGYSPWSHKESDMTERLSTAHMRAKGLPWWLGGEESARNAGEAGNASSVPGLGRSPGGGLGNLLQYSCLENPHEQKNLASCSPWGHKELDTTE